MDKVLIALGAVVGGLAFVIAMIGFAALVTYAGVIAGVALIAALIVAGIIKLLQAKVRMVVTLAFWAAAFVVGAIVAMLTGNTLVTLLAAVAGAALGAAYYVVYSQRIARAVEHEENISEYQDHDGKTHKYVLMGAHQLPPGLAERPVVVALFALIVYVVVFVVVVTAPQWIRNEWLGDWFLALFAGLLGALTSACLYTAATAEMKHDVEIFHQAIPDEASSGAVDWFDKLCPQPMKLIGDALQGIVEASKYVWSVSVRWG